ncbi:hypothetical protein SDC9_200547 [bioreactor metagenome]|uniref:Uncharacterized protein n=1 Tax=bioreactor metagenome TaxID=1076179 RepID=A0A645IWY6_9ZZZZ
MVCAIHGTSIRVESHVAGVHCIEVDRLAGTRFVVFAIRAHAKSGAAVFVIVEDDHSAICETYVI